MPRGGHNAIPVERKKAEGTLRSRDQQTPLVLGGRGLPEPPYWMSEGQREEYLYVRDLLAEAGILDRADTCTLENIAILRARVIACNAALYMPDANGDTQNMTVDDGAYGAKPHPMLGVQEKAIKELRMCYNELGLSPAARARLGNLGVKGKEATAELRGLGGAPTLKVVNGE